jgi:acyl-CoA thioester hydrolase
MTSEPTPRRPDPFRWPVRVYYEDTDAAGVVYYASYLRFTERARTEALRQLGFEQELLMRERSLGFVVKSVTADYQAPARLDDCLEVRSSIERLGRASLIFLQEILRKEELLFSSRIIIACVDIARQRPTSIPSELRSRLKAHFEK